MPRLRSLVLIVAAITLLSAGCGLAAAPVQGSSSPGPTINEDWPDPFVFAAQGQYYSYSTANGHGHIPVAVSSDLAHWRVLGDALPHRPSWTNDGPWAPTVIQIGNQFVMWYTTRYTATGRVCITSAVSANPVGPFVDNSNAPLICGSSDNIDPDLFTGLDGAHYVTWRHMDDGVAPEGVWSARLAADARSINWSTSTMVMLTTNGWERYSAENPTMLVTLGGYWLFYSGNAWYTDRYAVGVQQCNGPLGPCHAVYDGPILASRGLMQGPGGSSLVFTPSGGLFMAFHAWTYPKIGYPSGGVRKMFMLPVTFPKGNPVVG
ncbi:MAG TPA: glycoside hydrolase family 43 protein [Acidimicrobiia bacterium]